jgi:hypothetical protein
MIFTSSIPSLQAHEIDQLEYVYTSTRLARQRTSRKVAGDMTHLLATA